MGITGKALLAYTMKIIHNANLMSAPLYVFFQFLCQRVVVLDQKDTVHDAVFPPEIVKCLLSDDVIIGF